MVSDAFRYLIVQFIAIGPLRGRLAKTQSAKLRLKPDWLIG